MQKVRSGTSNATLAVIAPEMNATVTAPHDEHRGHHHAGEEARDEEEVDRVGGAHAQGVDLLGHDHRPDLGGDARAHARGEHQRADGGREIAHEELEVRRAELAEVGDDALGLQAGLVAEDHPDEAHRDRHEEERPVADLEHLPDDGAPVAPAARDVVERADEDRVELATAEEEIDRGGAQVAYGAGSVDGSGGRFGVRHGHPRMKLTR